MKRWGGVSRPYPLLVRRRAGFPATALFALEAILYTLKFGDSATATDHLSTTRSTRGIIGGNSRMSTHQGAKFKIGFLKDQHIRFAVIFDVLDTWAMAGHRTPPYFTLDGCFFITQSEIVADVLETLPADSHIRLDGAEEIDHRHISREWEIVLKSLGNKRFSVETRSEVGDCHIGAIVDLDEIRH